MECIPTATVPRRPQTVSAERRDGQEFSDSFTDLHMATYYGVQNILESLVVSNRKIDSHSRTPLWQAARDGQVAVVRLLLQEGAAVDSKDGLHCRTPLWWAAGNGHLAVVRLLLEKGAAVDSEDRQGRTPLWSAKETGHEVLVQLLESVSKRG
jgi:serine/threonine-protein phosphatase 6 regulatory ankyrin repeat subunit A